MLCWKSSALVVHLLSLTCLIRTSLCWGSLGHRTVAYLASEYLSPKASKYASTLLKSQDISDAALWADQVRRTPKYNHTAGWHYIDAHDDPPHECGVNIRRDCALRQGCVVSAIVNQTAVITSAKTDRAAKTDGLRFLLHFLGDIHQPLHTEAEGRGGNDIRVRFAGKHTNLHAIWDTDILNEHAGFQSGDGDGDGDDGNDSDQKAAARAWAKRLHAADPDPAASLASECQDLTRALDCAFAWADEANQWICDYVLKDDVAGVQGKDLSHAYYDGAVPVVDLLVGKAGRRLGAWINALAVHASKSASSITDDESPTDDMFILPEEL